MSRYNIKDIKSSTYFQNTLIISPKEGYKKLNLTSTVLVKLNEEGYKIWQEDYNKSHINKYSLSYFKKNANDEGYVKFVFKNFYELFSNHPETYDLNILIKEKYLER